MAIRYSTSKLCMLLVGVTLALAQDTPRTKPAVTRTSLHIARSLDPSETELLNVKSKNGEIATLIVKRREGRRTQPVSTEKPLGSPRIQDAHNLLRAGKANPVPNPVEIRSSMMLVKDEQAKKRGRTLTIDSDGVPVVEGVREPDTEEDKRQTWRNARVVDGVLMPYKQSLTRGKDKPDEKQEVSVSSYFEAREPATTMFKDGDAVKTQWKGIAETESLKHTKREPIPAKLIEYIMRINEKELKDRNKQEKHGRSIDMERRMDENVDENDEPIWVNTHTKEIWTENGKISIADRRTDDSLDEDDVDQSPPEARLLQPQGVSNHPVSRLYSPSRVSFEEGGRTPVLQYAHPELGVQPAKAHDSKETESVPEDTLPSLTYFSDDPYADRSPYAYEPGLMEDTLTANSKFHAPEVANSLGEGRRHSSIQHIEFTTSTPTINPDEIDITEPPRKFETTYGLAGEKYIKRYPYTGYFSGANSYPMTKDEYYKWKMSGMTYGNGINGGYMVKIPDNRPFWEKLTDSIKETVQSGVESMKDLTRPVMEPLVEATQRISENLGIHDATTKIGNTLGFHQGTGMRNAFQEKIGDVAASPVLLPALGLVAGGAALGLGAVAVGKMFDVNPVNLLKRSEDGDADGLQMEHKRAMEGAGKLPDSLEPEKHFVVMPVVQSISSKDPLQQERIGTGDLVLINGDKNLQKPERESVVLVAENKSRSLPEGRAVEKNAKQEFKKLIDESGIEGLERFHFKVDEESDMEHKSRRRSLGDPPAELFEIHRRTRRAPDIQRQNEEYLTNLVTEQRLDQEEIIARLATLGHPYEWTDTQCAKRKFCQVMLRQPPDDILLMEKKMAAYMSLLPVQVVDSVASHLMDVMRALQHQDCSNFSCHRSSGSPR